MDWRPDELIWYFDGKEVFRDKTPADMHQPMYIIANLAVGGTWPGNPTALTRFPSSFRIDYIRAYKEAPGARAAIPFDVSQKAPACPIAQA